MAVCTAMMRYLCVLLLSHLWIVECLADSHRLYCREQEQITYYCSAKIQDVYVTQSNNFHILCRALAQYLSCVRESKWTCPHMSVFIDPVFMDALNTAREMYAMLCGLHSPVSYRSCYSGTVSRLVRYCYHLVDKVQLDTPLQDICRINLQYVVCLQWLYDACYNSRILTNYSIPLALNSSMEFINSNCKELTTI